MRNAILAAIVIGSFACTGDAQNADVGDQELLEPADDALALGPAPSLVPGDLARVCNATALNQRSGPGTSYAVVKVMPSGSTTKILAVSGTWFQNDWNGSVGWSSGQYLCKAGGGDTDPGKGFESTEISRASFVSIGRAAVGYSYWWGGGRFATGAAFGTCSGSCPSCSHGGSFGADCSGFIGKAWLLPAALPMNVNKHPYTTASFASSSSLWSTVARSNLIQGDALVYRSGGAGHIVMYDKDDPWGSFWSYEARGCSYGVVHNIRTAGSAFHGIRRAGL